MRKAIIIVVGIFLLLVILGGGCLYYIAFRPNIYVPDEGILFIREGDSFETVVQILQSKGYVKNVSTLRKVASLKKYPVTIKSGRYRIKDKWNNNQLINYLRSGDQEAVRFTFNNIRTMEDFAEVVSRQLDIQADEIMQIIRDTVYLNSLGFTPDNFIGMFIPNTYQIYWNTSPQNFVKRMHAEYQKFWNVERRTKAEKAGLSPMDVSVIASIVEEETAKTDEYPTIAGVYINRLRKGWKLEACPTLKFALKDFTLQRILDRHLLVDSPYNTYKNPGLPPGPIRMPSIRAIDAVLYYEHHQYLFFCAKSDFSGRHSFSRTLRQHNKYAEEYHRALNKRGVY